MQSHGGSPIFRDHNPRRLQIESGGQCPSLGFSQLGQGNGIVRHRHTTGISSTFAVAYEGNGFYRGVSGYF
jgi:hypothetical protein